MDVGVQIGFQPGETRQHRAVGIAGFPVGHEPIGELAQPGHGMVGDDISDRGGGQESIGGHGVGLYSGAARRALTRIKLCLVRTRAAALSGRRNRPFPPAGGAPSPVGQREAG